MFEGTKRSCNFRDKQKNFPSKDEQASKKTANDKIDIYEYEEFVASADEIFFLF